jgi:hypothetical protein
MSLQLAGYPVTAVYSFGQPRVGDEQFRRMVVQHLGERYYRIDTPEDVTPHLPPTQASAQAFARLLGGNNAVTQLLLTGPVSRLGYASHAGQGYWLAGDGSVIAHGPETGEEEIAFWRSAIDDMGDLSLLPTDWMAFAGKRFSSHAPAFYLCRLAQSVAKMAGTELR